jgi:tetratricopeptide (TPR) repeat protein
MNADWRNDKTLRLFATIIAVVAMCTAASTLNSQTIQPTYTDRTTTEEFASLADSWNRAPTSETDFEALKRLAKLEPKLELWPLAMPRLEFRGKIFELLGDYYQKRSSGIGRDNQEQAISSYDSALAAFASLPFPDERANVQYKLARVYTNRELGDHADNLELAIAAFKDSLAGQLPTLLPNEWAQTQYYLANALSDLVRGDRSGNLELAIHAYLAALTVWNLDTFPESWAKANANLAAAYRNRVAGDPAENIETALKLYQAVGRVFTRDSHPQYWGWTQIDLGDAYARKASALPGSKRRDPYVNANSRFRTRTGRHPNTRKTRHPPSGAHRSSTRMVRSTSEGLRRVDIGARINSGTWGVSRTDCHTARRKTSHHKAIRPR